MTDTDVLLQRNWVSNPHPPPSPPIIGSEFHIVTYNLLADCYWDSPEKSHPWCPNGKRTGVEQFQQCLRELVHHNADIICLQEVASDLYRDHVKPRLTELGYQGSHHKRGQYDEGVATFFKKHRFELVEEKFIHIHNLIAKALEEANANKSLWSAVKTHPYHQRAVILSRLKCRQSNRIVAIGNVHLTFLTTHFDRVLLEVAMGMNELISFAGGVDQPHILCGDFNQEPWVPGYQLLQDGMVSKDALEQMKKYTLPEEHEEGEDFLADVLSDRVRHNSTHLQSAYKTVMGHEPAFTCHGDDFNDADTWQTGEPLIDDKQRRGHLSSERTTVNGSTVTKRTVKDSTCTNYENFKGKYDGAEIFIGTLDYLWYSSDTLYCNGVLEMVDESEISRCHSAPNAIFPSDHLLMKSQFQFIS